MGKIIAENTYYKIIFSAPHKENEYLDNFDLERIDSLSSKKGEYSEFYLKSPVEKKMLRLYPTVLEHERFTSHFKDRENIRRFVREYEKFFDYKTLIKRWTEVKYGEDINIFLADYKSD